MLRLFGSLLILMNGIRSICKSRQSSLGTSGEDGTDPPILLSPIDPTRAVSEATILNPSLIAPLLRSTSPRSRDLRRSVLLGRSGTKCLYVRR